jgi:hypothetical protein
VRLEGLGKLKKLNDSIRSRARDLPACNMVPKPLRYRVVVLMHRAMEMYEGVEV